MNDIYLIVKDSIMPFFGVIGKSFTKSDIESFLQVEQLDFMDKAILPICKENNCILLTNDKDFRNANIDLLTSNPAILRN